jgi:hippurate hydrolase
VGASYGAKVEVDFRTIFAPLINNAEEAEFAARMCSDIVGESNVERDPPLSMASEDFSFMLEAVPGCYINIGTGGAHDTIEEICEVHNPGYDFNDRALPLGASFFARVVETRLAARD